MSAVIDSMDIQQNGPATAGAADLLTRRPALAPKPMTATERLEATRANLRTEMLVNARPVRTSGGAANQTNTTALLGALRTLPGASLVVDTVLQWWSRHPLHDASVIAREASGAIFRPIARDNPMKLVLGALVFGALLVVLKPWRFILRSAIFAGLVPQFAAMALRRLPLATWIRMFTNRSKPALRSPAATVAVAPSRRAA